MNATRVLLIGLLLAAWLPLSTAGADAPKKCAVCQGNINGTFYWMNTPAFADRQPICEACQKITARCFFCKLPVKDNPHKLDDSRVLCDRDFRAGIFDEREALRVFEEAKHDVHRILHGFGVLPDRNITVSLVNGRQLIKLNQTLPSVHEDTTLLGLTRTEASSRKQYQHTISLLNGLNRAELAAVSAHEYTHAWLGENVPPERKLEKDTIEGFCELVAYKLMTQRNEEQQKRIILANAYTRGQINAFVQAENSLQFHRVVQWIKTGVDEMLMETNTTRVLTVIDDAPPPFVWPPPAKPTPVPGRLMLKGISGTAGRRFALINDTTLTKNEETKVRVGSSNVVVRCLDIKAGSVVIQIQGRATPTELFLATD
jgi:hypothetical protein